MKAYKLYNRDSWDSEYDIESNTIIIDEIDVIE